MSCFSASGGFAPDPTGAPPRTPLGDFRPPDHLNFASQLLTPGDATGKATNFKFGWYIHRVMDSASPNFGIVIINII